MTETLLYFDIRKVYIFVRRTYVSHDLCIKQFNYRMLRKNNKERSVYIYIYTVILLLCKFDEG